MVKKTLAAKLLALALASTFILTACDGGKTTESDPTKDDKEVTTEAPADDSKDDSEESTEESADDSEESTEESADDSEESTEESADDSDESTDESADDSDESTDESTDDSEPVDEEDLLESPDNFEPESPVTITYAGWENDLNFAIITEKFTERHPNIKVERFESEFVDEGELTRLAAAGELPDVFSINNIGLSAKNGWLLDLRERFEKDPIASKVSYQNIIDSLDIKGKLYALPTTVFLGALLVNTDLLEANNIPIPEYNWKVSEMKDILYKATVPGKSVGSMDVPFIYNWMPGNYGDDAYGRFFFDANTKRFVLDDSFVELVTLYKEIIDADITVWEHADRLGRPWDLEDGDPEKQKQEEARAALQIEKYGTTDHGWDVGRSAFLQRESHGMAWLETIPAYTGFKYDWYPFPMADDSTRETPRPGLVTDLAGLSINADDNADAAWEFLKYITFETVGYTDRIEGLMAYDKEAYIEKYGFSDETIEGLPDAIEDLYHTQGPHMNMIPPMNTKTALEAFKKFHPEGSPDAAPGMMYQAELIADGYVDLHRNQPGFNDAFGYIHDNMWSQIIDGNKAPADIAKELEDGANKIIDNWMKDIEAAIAAQE